VSSLTHWSVPSAASGRSAGEIFVVPGVPGVQANGALTGSAQALRLASPDHDGAPLSIITKTPFPVSPGETVLAACTARTADTRGPTAFQFQFYAAGGVPLGASEAQSPANALPSAQAVVPAGAVQATLKTSFIGWRGKLEISELAVWRSS